MALAVLGLTLAAGGLAHSATPRAAKHAVERQAEAMNLNLRLVDLPAGYEVTSDFQVGSDGACYRNVLHARGTPDFFNPPHVECKVTFGDSWRPPGVSRPEEIESAVLRFDDVAGATVGFRNRYELAYDLFDDTGGEKGSDRAPATPLGDEARVWTWDGGVLVAWRTGQTVSFIQTTSHWSPPTLTPPLTPLLPPPPPPPPTRRLARRPAPPLRPAPVPAPVPLGLQLMLERAALRYAASQQARVVKPTPLLPSDNDDSEVALESPRLHVAIRWLDRHFEPGGKLPPLTLIDSSWSHPGGEGPGWNVNMLYAGEGGHVSLSLWTVRGWARYRAGAIGRRVFDFPCTRPALVRASPGRAIVRSTRNSRGASCSSERAKRILSPDCSIDPNPKARIPPCYAKPGKHFLATVHLRDLVITVNAPSCVFCVSGSDYGVFNSAAGMRAIARGLRARPASAT